jgi:hypothetical protein
MMSPSLIAVVIVFWMSKPRPPSVTNASPSTLSMKPSGVPDLALPRSIPHSVACALVPGT